MLSAPIYAKITDRLKSAKNILRVGILFSIAGNCLYFMKKEKNFVVLARFISGIGWGLEGILITGRGVYNTGMRCGYNIGIMCEYNIKHSKNFVREWLL